MNQIGNGLGSIDQIAGRYIQSDAASPPQKTEDSNSFESLLRQKLTEDENVRAGNLRFSKHAAARLDERSITLTGAQSRRLEAAAQEAEEKGIKESLVLVDSLAFIVNVPNQTVVTAMDQSQSDEHVFTNIDGAVIA